MHAAGVPVFDMFAPFPISCFTGAVLTDISYYNTADIQWANFSAWFLAFGEFFLGFVILIAFIDAIRNWGLRLTHAWLQLTLYTLVFVVVMFDNFVHARDGWTSVVPQGLALSVTAVILMIIAAFVGYRTLRSEVRGA
jgi:uncharacterized membrane protein